LGCARVVTASQRSTSLLVSVISDVYEDKGMQNTARQRAHHLRDQFEVDPAVLVRERIMALL
jgi:hypothetical protein